MILIDGKQLDTSLPELQFHAGSVEQTVLGILSGSTDAYKYDSLEELTFELGLRREIVQAAKALHNSGLSFEVFRDSRCNRDYWIRRDDGGFELKSSVKPSDAIRDIYENGSEYGTECATAMQIVYYKALLSVYSEEAFNGLFRRIYLMNWHQINPALRETGMMRRAVDYLPGDRRYFSNPDVDPETPEWQGENVIDLGNGLYYGHGIGIQKADVIVEALNENRRGGATRSAHLLDQAARPDFKELATIDSGVIGRPERPARSA